VRRREPQFRVIGIDDLAAYCYCQAQVVWVPKAVIRQGETGSCGAPRCQPSVLDDQKAV
jgi:hypothetical protein